MQVSLCKEPFEFIVIDDTYTEDELKLIFLELDFWTLSQNFLNQDQTCSALWTDGTVKKKNTGIFLDEAYTNRSYSNILKLNRKIYNIKLDCPSVILNYLNESNRDATLVSYYENQNYYSSHIDNSVLTSFTYLYKQPKAFNGGNLLLTKYGYEFEPVFNRTYIIPSVVEHEVTNIEMKLEDCGKGLGRYCISNFIHQDTKKTNE